MRATMYVWNRKGTMPMYWTVWRRSGENAPIGYKAVRSILLDANEYIDSQGILQVRGQEHEPTGF